MEKFFDLAFETVLKGTEELYFRSEGFELENGMMKAERKGAEVSFDTYFNMIPSAKLRKYTSVRKITFMVSGRNIETEIFALAGTEKISLGKKMSVLVNDIPENAVYIYPVIRAESSGAMIEGISVSVEGSPVHNDISLIICTYKREEYLMPNLEYISREIKLRKLPIQLIVVDNAKSVSFAEIPDGVILIPNENTGGSGGFARGMAAAAEMKRFTHFILMDDDVKLDMISLQKLAGFLCFRKEKYKDISISGAMLYMDKPLIQFESGGCFAPDGTQKGFGHYLDMSCRKNLSVNEQPKAANYGGWWFMCMPMRYVYEGNYPMPFFLKYDDVEYALRCRLEIITLNGVSVWHEPFEWKYNSSAEYYNMRNYLYLRAMTDKSFTKRQARKIAYKQMFEKLCRQQYKMAEAVRLGYEDYLKGTEYLRQINAEENHRRICSLDYEMLSIDEIRDRYGIVLTQEIIETKLQISDRIKYKWYKRLLLYGLFIPKSLKKKELLITDAFFDRKEQYMFFKKALHFYPDISKGYFTNFSINFRYKKQK